MGFAPILYTIIIGIFTGFSAGMFGIGGALVSTPLLHELVGLSELLAVATPLPATIPAAISGSIVYLRKGLVRRDVVWRTLVTGLPVSILGAYVTDIVPGPILMILTGLVLGYSALIFLQRSRKNMSAGPTQEEGERLNPAMLYATGAVTGFISGFLAIGGGLVMVPAFVKIIRLSTKEALATSLACIAVLAVVGTVAHAVQDHIDWRVAGILCVAVIPFSSLGARAASSMKARRLEMIYGIVMLVFAVVFVVRNVVGKGG